MNVFETAMTHVLRWEGGYVHDPRDPGGETNMGISRAAHPDEDIPNMTRERATHLYKVFYWDKCGCDELPAPLALMVFDSAVNCGVKRALAWNVIAKGNLDKFTVQRCVHYALLDNLDDVYAKGWFNRLLETYRTAILMETP